MISRSAGYTGSIAKSLEAPYFTGAGGSVTEETVVTLMISKALLFHFFLDRGLVI